MSQPQQGSGKGKGRGSLLLRFQQGRFEVPSEGTRNKRALSTAVLGFHTVSNQAGIQINYGEISREERGDPINTSELIRVGGRRG